MRKLMVLATMVAVVAALGLLPVGETSATHQGGLAAYWPFDEGSGTTALDAAHGNDGTVTGATYTGGGVNAAPVPGNANALNFAASGDLVRVTDDASLMPVNVTVSAWVRNAGTPTSYDYILAKTLDGGKASYAFYTGGSSGLYFYVSGATYHLSDDAGTGIWDGIWHHVVGTYDGSEVRLFVDGSEIGTANAGPAAIAYGTTVFSGDLSIGSYGDLSSQFDWKGDIDEVCIWNRALAPTEIAGYASGVPCDLLFDDQAAFEAATGAAPLSIPAAADVGPPIAGLAHTGCADSISIPIWANTVTVTAPAANPHSSLPGLLHPICVIEPGVLLPLSNTNPHPVGPTMVANGEDDYLLVFEIPVDAVGVELLTNSPAVETVTLKDVGDNVIASLSVDSLTSPNTFQFVGFSSPTPIKSLFIDTTGGAIQNEGISAIKAPHRYVDIDIKPGSDPNCINENDHGVIPVAILGSATFDVTLIDPATVELGSLEVKAVGKSNKLLAHIEDVNNDGFDDLVVKIQDGDGNLDAGTGEATLTGNLFDGTPIEGTDSICIVPPES